MKIISKTLVAGAAVVTLAACNNGENNENLNVNDGLNDDNSNNEVEIDNNGDDNDEEANNNDLNDESEEEDETAGAGSIPVENVSIEDGVLSYEYNGTSGEVGADMLETVFGKELAVPDSMSTEEAEEGTHRLVNISADDGSDLAGLHISVREGFSYEQDEVLTSQVDTERSAELQGVILETAGHVENFDTVHLDDETPFQFYFHVNGDASEPGQFPDAVDGEAYEQYKFYEIVEEGYYYVDVMMPAESDDELIGTGLAIASTFSPDGATLEEDDDADNDEENEEE